MLFAGREVRTGKNCARGLEYRAITQDLGHSFFQYGPPGRQITYISFIRNLTVYLIDPKSQSLWSPRAMYG